MTNNLSHNGSNTAAAIVEGLADDGNEVNYEDMQAGDLIFYSYVSNGRYKNISHVAIYVGGGKVVEARGTAYGVVYVKLINIRKIVMIGKI